MLNVYCRFDPDDSYYRILGLVHQKSDSVKNEDLTPMYDVNLTPMYDGRFDSDDYFTVFSVYEPMAS